MSCDSIIRLICVWGLAGLVFVVTLKCTASYAEPPAGLPNVLPAPAQDKGAAPPKPSADDATLADLRDKRDKVEAELKAASQPGALEKSAPSAVPREELLERRSLLQQVVRGYDEQLDDVRRLEKARERHAEIRRASAEWKGFAESPPYSVFLGDELWDAAFSLRLAMEGLQAQLSLIELRFDRAHESLKEAEGGLRQASEQLEAAHNPEEAARLRWMRDQEELRRRAAAVGLAAAELSKKRVEEELAETRARLEFARRQLEAAEPHVVLNEEDLNKIRTRLSQESHTLHADMERLAVERRAQARALQQAERQLKDRLAARPSRGTQRAAGQTARAEAAVELKRAQVDNLSLKIDLLKQLLDVVEGERQLWESRFAVAQTSEPGKAREAYARYTPLFTNFHASRDYLRQQLVVVSGQISELDNRLRNASNAEERSRLRRLLEVHREREEAYNQSLRRLDQAARFLDRWQSEITEERKELPLSARMEDWLQRAWETAKTGWNFEVFAAEDTIEVDGKKITGRRSVTVGKIVSALAILVVGYWICLYLARLLGRLAVTRLGMAPEVANLVRQWSQAVLITILIVISFVSVKIPLTVFAFLGGAFAIGVGFGAQNLLKNVISGVLLLVERPLRVGDLIEVDNIRGRVTTIGLRSSTVRDAKGMETLIPNSSFLERHLTNWTYSSRISRFSLRVGAPYQSSTHAVIELLADIAKEHPRVLKVPQPQVLLEEFGSQARIFTLNYWLEIRLDVDPNEVASELRFAIEKKFTDAGLKVLPAA